MFEYGTGCARIWNACFCYYKQRKNKIMKKIFMRRENEGREAN